MPRFKSVSRTPNYTRLKVGDKKHIASMVEEFKKTDKRFENEASAIRHYVHLGIVAETSTDDLRNSLDSVIVRDSQKEAVRDELKPLAGVIKTLVEKLDEQDQNLNEFFADLTKRTEKIEGSIDAKAQALEASIVDNSKSIESRIELNFSQLFSTLTEITKQLSAMFNFVRYILRNLIILRSVIYIFLLGYKTGIIEGGKESQIIWNNLIQLAHQKAMDLSLVELTQLKDDQVESTVIQKMASDIFKEVTSKPQPRVSTNSPIKT